MTLTDEVRSFNRFYTREIGLLNRRLPATDLSLPEARVLYELAHAPESGRTAAEIGRALGMDKAHLSRIVARFRARELMQSRVSADHGKHRLLTLTDVGQKTFAAAEAAARAQVDALLTPIGEGGRERLAEAMRDIRAAPNGREAEQGDLSLRPLRPGDVGWIIHRQTVLYHQEYGWDWTYEGLASRILGAFVAEFDSAKEDGWVAERVGAIVGSIFLMKSDDPAVAKLRLLYV
ncbi:MarR family winged helix-turn-helix transcriptional regulator, partial [Roseiarcus sp.]|uniref:MarR family winged helix-turn-helix transcriptional regulator n=1 Tax=Roseiarcus sp. TaxID=1969460 RepID=UPI003D0C25F6